MKYFFHGFSGHHWAWDGLHSNSLKSCSRRLNLAFLKKMFATFFGRSLRNYILFSTCWIQKHQYVGELKIIAKEQYMYYVHQQMSIFPLSKIYDPLK